jgi:hypothetical protein
MAFRDNFWIADHPDTIRQHVSNEAVTGSCCGHWQQTSPCGYPPSADRGRVLLMPECTIPEAIYERAKMADANAQAREVPVVAAPANRHLRESAGV